MVNCDKGAHLMERHLRLGRAKEDMLEMIDHWILGISNCMKGCIYPRIDTMQELKVGSNLAKLLLLVLKSIIH